MLLFLVTPCLVKTVQPCMKWIPTFKKWPPTTYLIPNDKKTLTKCHKYKRCTLFSTCTKPVACVLVCAHVITHIKWWRLIKVWFSLSSSVYLWDHCYVKVCSVSLCFAGSWCWMQLSYIYHFWKTLFTEW